MLSQYGILGIVLTLSALVLLAVQLYFHLRLYGLTARPAGGDACPGDGDKTGTGSGISVVVPMGDDYWFLENILPKILAQDHKELELVIVEIGTTEDFSDRLIVLKEQYPRLTVTRVDNDPRFPISNKIAYNIGIKAARYENIILTTSDAYPVSGKWIAQMAKGFSRGDIVIGYCGMEKKEGRQAALMRSSKLFTSVRFLSAARGGRPYRGIIQNLGFSKRIYFDANGFDHLNMNLGEDDLFVQRLVRHGRATVVISPYATVRQVIWGGRTWWWERRKFYDATSRYYPAPVKAEAVTETLTRMFFYLAVLAMVILLPWELKVAAVVMLVARMLLVRYYLWRWRVVLGEPGLGNSSMLFDLYYPFSRVWLTIMGRIKPAPGVWK